jgi:hypothetical protein
VSIPLIPFGENDQVSLGACEAVQVSGDDSGIRRISSGFEPCPNRPLELSNDDVVPPKNAVRPPIAPLVSLLKLARRVRREVVVGCDKAVARAANGGAEAQARAKKG